MLSFGALIRKLVRVSSDSAGQYLIIDTAIIPNNIVINIAQHCPQIECIACISTNPVHIGSGKAKLRHSKQLTGHCTMLSTAH